MAEIAVDAEILLAHAGRVEQVAADVHEGLSAAASTDLAGGAFGVLCGFLMVPATAASFAGRSAISSAEQLVSRAAGQVRGWSADAQAVDQAACDAVASLRSALDAL